MPGSSCVCETSALNLTNQEDQSLHWHTQAVRDSVLWAAEDVLEFVG